ncbi:vacuolar protein-sorting-associated protein 25 [Macrosteles quadrilineatus]|uniref:vacuolar protein-sorting-associated protein 25 n=1 Tax=Macrosteles quadrilineatus TaxID=74068 RepID=UPI0023E347F6|nr:vacuolar protein-sorting-associated protein 25 [Macrosteles quadrilineatus]
MGTLEWPWQYSFPPFFTIQPNEETRKKQLDAWKSLVLEYHRSEKLYVLDLREAETSPLFNNASISRKLSTEGILIVLEALQRGGRADPLNKERTRWHIYWHSLAEWGSIIYSWIQESGQLNSVCTLYEIAHTPDQEFTNIDSDVLIKIIKVLEKQNKAELIMFDGNSGVKFF